MAATIGVKNILDVTNLQSNALGQSYHSSNDGSVPYAIGRFFFASLQLKLFKE